MSPRMPLRWLQALVLVLLIWQNCIHAKPLMPMPSNHRRAGEDVTDDLQDAPRKLQTLIFCFLPIKMIYKQSPRGTGPPTTDRQERALKPKASNHRKGREKGTPKPQI